MEILPELDASGENFVFSFTRLVASTSDTAQVFQYGSNIDVWTDVNITSPTGTGVEFGTIIDGLQTVTVTISKSSEANGKLFGRLKVISDP